jgi:hypothetical protein
MIAAKAPTTAKTITSRMRHHSLRQARHPFELQDQAQGKAVGVATAGGLGYGVAFTDKHAGRLDNSYCIGWYSRCSLHRTVPCIG